MYSTTILFSILAVLANCNTATANPNHANVSKSISWPEASDLLLISQPQLVKLVSPELLDRSLLGGDNSYYQTSDGTPYGFGWFHPGAFNEGDRCWQNDREGLIGNALCIIVSLSSLVPCSLADFFRLRSRLEMGNLIPRTSMAGSIVLTTATVIVSGGTTPVPTSMVIDVSRMVELVQSRMASVSM